MIRGLFLLFDSFQTALYTIGSSRRKEVVVVGGPWDEYDDDEDYEAYDADDADDNNDDYDAYADAQAEEESE